MRLDSALRDARERGDPIVVPYLVVDRARHAGLSATVRALRGAGATALELGFPFSDPIADGPVLEAASDRALRGGTRWEDLRAAARAATAHLPSAAMTYANPVLRRGRERALAELASDGLSGLIVPDLSLEEAAPWRRASDRAGISLVLMAAPGGSAERVRSIATVSRGFLYVVSRYGTTGRSGTGSAVNLAPIVRAARRAAPDLPVLVGFGIRDRRTAERALDFGADGVVVGSALEEAIARDPDPESVGKWFAGLVPRPR